MHPQTQGSIPQTCTTKIEANQFTCPDFASSMKCQSQLTVAHLNVRSVTRADSTPLPPASASPCLHGKHINPLPGLLHMSGTHARRTASTNVISRYLKKENGAHHPPTSSIGCGRHAEHPAARRYANLTSSQNGIVMHAKRQEIARCLLMKTPT